MPENQTSTKESMSSNVTIAYHSINGQIVSADQATIGVKDLALLRGYGIFDYFQFFQGKPMFFQDYLERFERSAKTMDIELPLTLEELKARILKLIKANGHPNGGIRLVLTGGYSPDGYSPVSPNLLILQYPATIHPESMFTAGIKLLLHQYMRDIPDVKSTNYLMGIKLRKKLLETGSKEPLYHDGQFISETTRANFFIVDHNDSIITAKEGILQGITRMKVLEVARQSFNVIERPIELSELSTAKEAFITSTTRGAVPVVEISDQVIGNGKVGPVTKKLMEAFTQFAKDYLKQSDY